jgi:hypothetical protein
MKKRINYKLFIIAILSIFSFIQNTFSQAPNWIWAKSTVGDSGEVAQSIATDNYGNIYVTGTFTSPVVSFGTLTLFNSGDEDIFVAKYDPNGNPLWAKSARGTYWDRPTSITVDAFDNVYVTGYFESDTLYFDADTLINLYYGSDLFIAKYDSSGNVLWAKRDGIGASQANAITADISGNVYITGYFYSNNLILGSDTLINSTFNSNSYDVFTAKYDSSGNDMWARGGGGTYPDQATAIASDHNGGLYITGHFNSSYINFDTIVLPNNGLGNSEDIFIVKYDTAGNVIWAKNEGGISGDIPMAIDADNNGNFYLAGHFDSSSIIFGLDTFFNTTLYYPNMFIAKYGSAGNVIWAKSATSNPYGNAALSVTHDSAGNVYASGAFSGSSSISFDSLIVINPSPYNDIFVVKYNSNGNILWVKSAYGNIYGSYPITYDNSGSIYVAGGFRSDTISFDSFVIPNSNPGCSAFSPNCYDMFLAKLNTITGIEENPRTSIVNIFPNPFISYIVIKGTKQKGRILLFDLTGKKIMEQETFDTDTKITTEQLQAGFYLLNYTTNNETIKFKLVKL